MSSVGEALRRARLEQGLDLATVSARTKIKEKHLEAIEADDRASLPSSFFYKHFVQQYARLLSLDTGEIDAEIERLLSTEAPLPLPGEHDPNWRRVPPLRVSSPFDGARIYASLCVLALIVAGCSGIYVWYKHRSTRAAKTELAASTMAGKDSRKDGLAVARPLAAPAGDLQTVADAPAAQPAPERRVLLDLMAHEETWLSVSSDGKPVFSGILGPNQSKTVEGKEYAKMRVGNAAGIEVRLNGRPLGPLGHRGQVLVVVFTPDNFQIMSPPKESD